MPTVGSSILRRQRSSSAANKKLGVTRISDTAASSRGPSAPRRRLMRPVQSATRRAERHTRLTHIHPSQERARITPTATPPPRPRRYAASHFDILDTAPTRPLDSTTPPREMTVPDAPHRSALTDDPVPASITGYEQSAGAVAIAADPRADSAARRYAPAPLHPSPDTKNAQLPPIARLTPRPSAGYNAGAQPMNRAKHLSPPKRSNLQVRPHPSRPARRSSTPSHPPRLNLTRHILIPRAQDWDEWGAFENEVASAVTSVASTVTNMVNGNQRGAGNRGGGSSRYSPGQRRTPTRDHQVRDSTPFFPQIAYCICIPTSYPADERSELTATARHHLTVNERRLITRYTTSWPRRAPRTSSTSSDEPRLSSARPSTTPSKTPPPWWKTCPSERTRWHSSTPQRTAHREDDEAARGNTTTLTAITARRCLTSHQTPRTRRV